MPDYKTETLEVYSRFPDFFDQKFERYLNNFIKQEVEDVCFKFPKKAKILDLGSGPGNHALFLKKKGFDVLCLDNSPPMLQVCHKKGLNTILMDIDNLYFPRSRFDVVWAYASLIHVPKSNVPKILEDIHSIIRDDGLFFLSLKEGQGERLKDFVHGGKRWFSLYTDEEIRELLKGKFEIIGDYRVLIGKEKVFLDYLCKKVI